MANEETTQAVDTVTELVGVSASPAEDARTIKIPYNFGANLDEAIALFGEEAVFESYKADAIVGLQGYIRRMLKLDGDKAMTDEQILEKAAGWKPGAKIKKSAAEKAAEMLSKLSEEDRLAVLKAAGLLD